MNTTTATPTQTVYKQAVTGHPAPRDPDRNLDIAIQLDNQTWEATFVCAEVESVGDHKQRKVWFTASEDCTLHFIQNGSVFDIDEVVLFKHIRQSVPVADDKKHKDWAECWVTPGTATADDPHRTPPRIEVP